MARLPKELVMVKSKRPVDHLKTSPSRIYSPRVSEILYNIKDGIIGKPPSTTEPLTFNFLGLPQELREMVYGYVFSNTLLELPRPTREMRFVAGILPSSLNASVILATSKFINAEALPIWYRDAKISIRLGLVKDGGCCDVGIVGDACAAISPSALLQTSSNCTHGHLTRSSLCRFRNVSVCMRYAEFERGSGGTDEIWDAHIEHLTELAKLLGAPGGGLRQLLITLDIYVTKRRPLFCTFVEPEKSRVRPLLRAFREHVMDKYITAGAMVNDEHTCAIYESGFFEQDVKVHSIPCKDDVSIITGVSIADVDGWRIGCHV